MASAADSTSSQLPLSPTLVQAVFNTSQPYSEPTDSKVILFPTACVKSILPHRRGESTYVLLDHCADIHCVTKAASPLFHHQILKEHHTIQTQTMHGKGELSGRLLKIQFPTPNNSTLELEALEVDRIMTVPAFTIRLPQSAKDIRLAIPNPSPPTEIGILLGLPEYNDIVLGQTRPCQTNKHRPNKGFLLNTTYGYVFSGEFYNDHKSHKTHSQFLTLTPAAQLAKLFEQSWKMDDFQSTDSSLTVHQELAISKFNDSLKYDEKLKRYTVAFLFKEQKPRIVNNYFSARARLNQMYRKLQRNPEALDRYKEHVETFIKDGNLEPVHDDNPADPSRDLYYLSSRIVFKSNKYRLVIDPSARMSNGESLNSQILPGPPLQIPLHRILLKFRVHEICGCADLKKMFLQIFLDESCRDYARFLYFSDDPNKPLIFRLKTLAFGFTDSPYVSQAVVRTHAAKMRDNTTDPYIHKAALILKETTFVDDISFSVPTTEDAIKVYDAIQTILQGCGFTARKWASNSTTFINYIPSELRAPFEKIPLSSPNLSQYARNPTDPNDTDLDNDCDVISSDASLLGMRWCPRTDTLSYCGLASLAQELKPTKRSICSLIAKVGYDPLGLLSSLVLPARKLLKETCDRKLTFTEQLPDDIYKEFVKWSQQLSHLATLTFPRHTPVDDTTTFHVMADGASTAGYGACVFTRTKKGTSYTTHLFFARSRIRPQGEITVARLELKALAFATDLAMEIQTMFNLPTDKFFLYSDSTIVLWQLRIKQGDLRQYEARRVAHCLHSGYTFRKIDTKQNVADLFSRGATVDQIKSPFYQIGPPFLRLEERLWDLPEQENIPDDFTQGMNTQATIHLSVSAKNFNITPLQIKLHPGKLQVAKDPSGNLLTHIRLDRYYHTLRKLLSVTAAIFKYTARLAHGQSKTHLQLVEASMIYWIRIVQHEHLHEQIDQLRNNKPVKKIDKLRHLNPYLNDKDLICLTGRLQDTHLPNFVQHPIVIPHCSLAYLIVWEIHQQHYHGSTGFVLAHVEVQYWILSSKTIAKRVQQACHKCRKFHATRATQIMHPVPPQRVQTGMCFVSCSLDFFGPFPLKSTTQATTTRQFYCHVYRCQASGAIALDLVFSRTAEEFLLSFKRLVAKYGFPRHLTSDCAPEFKKSHLELQHVIAEANKKIADEGQKYRLDWHFLTPYASSSGGFHEIAVREAKYALYKTIGHSTTLTVSQMSTVLAEISAILCDRPLAKSEEDAGHYITASDLIYGRRLRQCPPGFETTPNPNPQAVISRHKERQDLVDRFWRLWKKTYLKSLQVYHKWEQKKPVIYVGQLVSLESQLTKKHCWDTYVIDSIRLGRDNLPRSATLRRSARLSKPTRGEIISGQYKHSPCEIVPSMPLSRIFPLETERPPEEASIYKALENNDMSVLTSTHSTTHPCCAAST